LLPALENAGLKVCIDYRDFDAGKPSIVNMEDAVDESRHTVLVLTPNWTGSEWTDFEAVLTQTDDPVGRRQKMIPIMLEKCEPPKRVRALTYVDFMRSDRLDNAWTQLFKALGKPETFKPSNLKPETHEAWHLAHPYPMPPNFTGRATERALLTHWLTEDSENRLFILCALGGFGKSALAWHWLTHDVDATAFPKVLWWSFYEGDSSFEHFVEETLKYLKRVVPQNKRAQVDELLQAMSREKVLLIMDGFERTLRAYSSMSAAYQGDEEPKADDNQLDCVDVNAETFLKGICSLPQMQGKVLMTTRLTPRAVQPRGEFLQGCHEVELTAMDKADAVEFFKKQNIKGTHTEIETACEPYGYHPLSLRLLAGRITKDFENPGDIRVSQHLKIDGDIIRQKHHVLEVSYNSLPASEQKLLSTIACFRSAVELKTIEAIVAGATHASPLQTELRDLVDRGLLHFDDKNKKFDLHPIVRCYAYDRLTAADRTGAHERLVNYFKAIPDPEKVEKLEDLAPVIELYHHMVRAGNLDEACDLIFERLVPNFLFFQFGAYQLCVELLRALFPDGEDKPPRLKDESGQAWTLNGLANSYSLSGQPRRAVPLVEGFISISEKRNDKTNTAIGLGNAATLQLVIGALSAAERNLRRRIELCREIADEFREAVGHEGLGCVLSYCGVWQEAEQELRVALKLFDQPRSNVRAHWVGLIHSDFAIRLILMKRLKQNRSLCQDIFRETNEAISFMEEFSKTNYPIQREYVRNFWLLGAAYRANNELTLAEENLSKALSLCRQINMVDTEADILLDLARLRYAQGDFKDAQEKASEALVITERSGYVLQGADVHLFLAELALAGHRSKVEGQLSDKDAARKHAEEALRLAHCDDGPPYYYKVAYEEAERMIEKLKS
jgi:tetratricopeptide (TPR) repeat protein